MGNLFNYVEKYGNIPFTVKEFNEIDNLVFSSLVYLDFSNTNMNKGKYTIEELGREYLGKRKNTRAKKWRIAGKNEYDLLEMIIKKPRYKSVVLTDYIYNVNRDMQFSAMTFRISRKLKYICFEGTDQHLSGWKEDGALAYSFPTPSQLEAIKYVNKFVNPFGPDVILGGHSKGGNLALVAGMYMSEYKKGKVKKIYNNDGPGLREKEFTSRAYQKIKEKYIHIVPSTSVVGILLRNDSYKGIKTSKKGIFSHFMTTWYVEDDHLVPNELTPKTKALEANILAWLEKHTDYEKEKMFHTLFKVLEDADIDEVKNIVEIKNMKAILRNIKQIDTQTRELVLDFLNCIVKKREGKKLEPKDSKKAALHQPKIEKRQETQKAS